MIEAIKKLDFYKTVHGPQYPDKTEYVYSGWTPRSTHYAQTNKITVFGNQGMVLKFLVKEFNETFFKQPLEKVLKSYKRRMDNALGKGVVGTKHIEALHKLGFLPLHVKGLPEGVEVNPKIPTLTMINTHPEFYWLTNYLETAISGYLWVPYTSASIAREYFRILMAAAIKTGTPTEFVPFQGHDFSMRGMYPEAAQVSSAAHLAMGFVGTDTVTAIDELEAYYYANSDVELVGTSVPATEHSVMCMGGQDDELGTFRRLLSLYPAGIVSIVSDTWDFWKVITEYAVTLQDEIRARKPIMSYAAYDFNESCAGELQLAYDKGFRVAVFAALNGDLEYVSIDLDGGTAKLGATVAPPEVIVPSKTVFRPDSGCPVKILTGYTYLDTDESGIYTGMSKYEIAEYIARREWKVAPEAIKLNGMYWDLEDLTHKLQECEVKGAVETLWDSFGGEINDKGFKQLQEVGLIYGDSITLERARLITDRLAAKGFASGNVVLGIGSFTYQYNTRDTYGFAMKATWGQVDGIPRDIMKDPKTDDGTKKSAKGLMRVELEDGEYVLYDQQTKEQEAQGELRTIFLNGELYNQQTLAEIRENASK